MAANSEILPQELILDICIRLRARTVSRFRCVSKHWFSLLSDPLFIKSHLTLHHHNYDQLKLIGTSLSALHTVTLINRNGADAISRKLYFEPLPDDWDRVVGSCNGLVLVVSEKDDKYLINPTTLHYHRIPDFHLAPPLLWNRYRCGLGYDIDTDDYKVVSLYQYDDDEPHNRRNFFDVYSVRKGCWRRLEKRLPRDYYVDVLACGVPLNGTLHWLATVISKDSHVIVAFDLSKEEFFEMPAPTTPAIDGLLVEGLVAHRGLLCMYSYSDADKIDVWMMKNYGDEQSWTKFELKGEKLRFGVNPVHLTSEGDVVLHNGGLIIYDKKKDQLRDMMVDGTAGSHIYSSRTFMESLVPPK